MGIPPVVSPRTSSNRNASANERNERSRRTGHTNEPTKSPRDGDAQQERMERQRSNSITQVNGADLAEDNAVVATRARRRQASQTPTESLPLRPSGGRDQRATNAAVSIPKRQITTDLATSSPGGLSREASEVLNRIVISKPEVDIERERERMAEAIPSSSATQSQSPGVPTGGLSIVPSEGIEDGGRGGSRSRHDHAPSSSKREKNSRFGEYYLGNTLGEGEFGKVKMGWKQEGGVQVSKIEHHGWASTNTSQGCDQTHPSRQRWHKSYETCKNISRDCYPTRNITSEYCSFT